jgi:hypothetical protein
VQGEGKILSFPKIISGRIGDVIHQGLGWRRCCRLVGWLVVTAHPSAKTDADAFDCTTRLENTHGTNFRELLYPWHPWFGLQACVHAAIDRSGGNIFRCTLRGSDADRWLEVPAWMFDRSTCAKLRVAADANADLAALTSLAALLQHVLNGRFALSNAPRSGVAGLSRDPNRGEVHAIPDEAEVGAPPRTAADRPVRSRTANGERPHAGVVRAAKGDTGSTDRPDDTVASGAYRQEPHQLDGGVRS